MGCDIHLVLERRVPDRITLDSRRHLGDATDAPLPPELMNHCAAMMTPSFEWLPILYQNWLTLPDSVVSEDVHRFDEVRAARLLSLILRREVAPEQSSMWVHIVSLDWQSRVEHDSNGNQVLDGHTMGDINHEAQLAGELSTHLDGHRLLCHNETLQTLRERDYCRFALLSSAAVCGRVSSEGIEVLQCMRHGIPGDAHASYIYDRAGEHSDCWCSLDALLKTDWGVVASARGETRSDIMGANLVGQLNAMGCEIREAGLSLCDFRLLISFDS